MINVLIVDDDHLVRKGFIAMMPWEAYGLRVVGEAGNGKKALEFMDEHPVDLLITDLAMPVMSGLDLMKEVKQRYPFIYMVVLTFHQDFEQIQDALRLGALDYITKIELEHEQLDEVLCRILERFREREALTAGDPSDLNEAPNELQPVNSPICMKSLIEIGDSWSLPDWMMEERVFQQLLERTGNMKLSPIQLERLFYVAMDHWKRLFGGGFLQEALANRQFAAWSDWASWLTEVRAVAQAYNQTEGYSAEVKTSIWKAVSFIQSELQEDLLLPDVAKRVNMSRSYFSRCFRDIVGTTFNDYVRDVRVEHAKVLLRQTGKSVSWIATQSGYPNEKYFCRMFREVTGMLPRDFRKQANETRK